MDVVTDELKFAIDNNAPLLSLRGASLSIGKRKILDQINLDVAAGEVVTIIGPNGAGKTSLLKVALGLVRPNAGTVKATRGMRIGYMPQRVAIDDTLPLTVARFLALAARRQRRDLARAVAETGIENLLEYPVQAISGGEMQRVLLARALARRPHLLVLDEPAQGLDIAAEGEFYDLIDRQRQNQGLGVFGLGQSQRGALPNVGCLDAKQQHQGDDSNREQTQFFQHGAS